jgi:Ion channel
VSVRPQLLRRRVHCDNAFYHSGTEDPQVTDRRAGEGALNNYALTVLLVLEALMVFVAAPLAAMDVRLPLLFGVGLLAPTALVIIAMSPGWGARTLAAAAIAIAIGGVVFRVHFVSVSGNWFGHGAVIAGLLAISWVTGRAVFASGRITHHRIEGAVILYLNIAMIFTSAYRLIYDLDPAAFQHVAQHESEVASMADMLYFSFTVLTSTGFGDVLPINPFARSLANLETVLGQLYLIILLGRLVTLHAESGAR